MDGCTQLVLHPLRNVQPVQLVVQEMAESAVVLACVADNASGSIQYSTTTTTTIIILLYSAVE